MNALGKIGLCVGSKFTHVLVNTGATFSILNPMGHTVPPFWSNKSIQMVRVSNQPTAVFLFKPIPFQLRPITGTYQFFLVCFVPIHLLGQDFQEAHQAHKSFSLKGEIILELQPPVATPPEDSNLSLTSLTHALPFPIPSWIPSDTTHGQNVTGMFIPPY